MKLRQRENRNFSILNSSAPSQNNETSLHFSPRVKNLHTRKTSNGSNFGSLIRQMSINQKSGRQTFRRRFVSGSLFVSPCPPECYLQSETKIQPDLRLIRIRTSQRISQQSLRITKKAEPAIILAPNSRRSCLFT